MYKIYKLKSTKTELVYIGCTSSTLKRRHIEHRSAFNVHDDKLVMYNKLRELNLTIDDFKISLLMEIEDRSLAFKTETKYINLYREACGVFNTSHENHWLRGTKGLVSANSGSFKKGKSPNETSFKKGNVAWNKGITGVQEGSCTGTITVNNGEVNKRIDPKKLDEYLEQGFVKGMHRHKKAKGVYFHKRSKKWQSRAIIEGKDNYIGSYKTEQEAVLARKKFLEAFSI